MSESDTKSKAGRIIIYGAGGIGCVVGGHSFLKGYDVTLIGRPGHMNAIREHGLTFVTPNGTHTLKMDTATSPAEVDFRKDDVILLCMKGQNTEGAMKDLKAVVDDVPIFCLQNGVRNEEIVSEYFPRVYGVMVRVGAEYLKDGEVICRRDPPGWLIIGCYPTGIDELAENVAAVLRNAGLRVLVSDDVMPHKWGKLMINLGNAIGAITNESGMFRGPVYQAVREEAQAIVSEAGIHIKPHEKLAEEWAEFAEKPRAILQTPGQSSTWQSLSRRQGSVELDFLNGEIVRVAKRLGKEAPINEGLSRIAKEMAAKGEEPGKYSTEELCKMLGLENS